MRRALQLAETAGRNDEVPVGAVVVVEGEIVGEGFNQTIKANDPTAHAEIVALRNAAKQLGNYRLIGSEVYSTIEPCVMCAGAMIHARVSKLYFGAKEPRAGAAGSMIDVFSNQSLNHRVEVDAGLCEDEASGLMKDFFKVRR